MCKGAQLGAVAAGADGTLIFSVEERKRIRQNILFLQFDHII
jgi:hypothetical protein